MIANMGTAKIAPGTPHIQSQKIRERITATGFIVNRFASSIGVTISPSITWMPKYRAAGNKAAQAGPLLINPTARKRMMPQNGPRIGTKFRQNATAPQSTGPGTSHSHIDVDTTVKPLYGHQEAAEVGDNPTTPGRRRTATTAI